MSIDQWFVFDLGNVVIRLDYERMLRAICAEADTTRDQLVKRLEWMGGYRDLERGAVAFSDFHRFLRDQVRFRGSVERLREIWGYVLEGPVEGIESLLERVRAEYRVAFLSNTNEVHVEQIFRRFGLLFDDQDRFIFSHRHGLVKPDPAIYQLALKVLGALPAQLLYVDDLPENVFAAKDQGIRSFLFTDTLTLVHKLESQKLLQEQDEGLNALLAE